MSKNNILKSFGFGALIGIALILYMSHDNNSDNQNKSTHIDLNDNNYYDIPEHYSNISLPVYDRIMQNLTQRFDILVNILGYHIERFLDIVSALCDNISDSPSNIKHSTKK